MSAQSEFPKSEVREHVLSMALEDIDASVPALFQNDTIGSSRWVRLASGCLAVPDATVMGAIGALALVVNVAVALML